MHPFKKFLLSILIILVLVSIFQDLSHLEQTDSIGPISNDDLENNYDIMPVKVTPGDTVLSIIETIHNGSLNELNMEAILTEFRKLNPTTEPTEIKVDHVYYFPLMKN